MTVPSETVAPSISQSKYTPLEYMEKHHAALYKTFKAGTCRPLAYRRAQLHAYARMMKENADAFADAVFKDLGKPKFECVTFEIGPVIERSLLCAERLEEWAAPVKATNLPDWQKSWNPIVHRAPKGPVLILAPWNYPIILSLQPLYAAISAGCPAAIKPSEFVPAFATLLAELVPKYLDPTAYIVINGAVLETTKLLELRWSHIFYTGNGRVGRVVATAAAKHLTPVSLELGGKSPVLIDAKSTDLRIAARRVLYGKCPNAGQTCIAPDYVLIERDAQDEFVAALKEVYDERYPDGALASDSYGRIINLMHFKRLQSLLSASQGNIVLGGESDVSTLKIAPTVLTNVSGSDSLMSDEIFGPILPIVPVSSLSEAIDFINDHDHPLSFYAFTESAEVKERLLTETLTGSLIFNDTFDQLAVNEIPFVGVGESGYGLQVMKYGYEGFTHMRSSLDVPLSNESLMSARYPPYTPENYEFMSMNLRLPIPPATSS